ncbi:hypothetical protein [Bartonella taylorii]|nr:hypothetical protein [Bartonella taylorii]
MQREEDRSVRGYIEAVVISLNRFAHKEWLLNKRAFLKRLIVII